MPPISNGRLPAPVRTKGGRLRPVVRSVAEALRLIDEELPIELRRLRRWTFARALMEEAAQSGKKADLSRALRQFTQALANDDFLAE
jgi:hypothetical protein